MSEVAFQESFRRSVTGHAADYVRRGLWAAEGAEEAMAKEFNRLYPRGRETPDRYFATVIDVESRQSVGETWYLADHHGGKVRFWIDWIWIEPEHRRQGFATAVFTRLEEEARRLGADRVGLTVWCDNPGAIDLYRKLGYTTSNMSMMKTVNATP